MATDPREGLPPDLERQLERLERLGNAEADLSREVVRDARPAPTRRLTDRAHRARVDGLRRSREHARSRRLGLLLLGLSPVLTLGYALAGYLERGSLALLLLLLAGLATSAAVVILYVSRERTRPR